jgi:WD40 repeat protein
LKLSNDKFATCSDDKTIKIWNFPNITLSAILEGHTESVMGLEKINKDTILSCSSDTTIKKWNLLT